MGYSVEYLADKNIICIKVQGKLNFQMAERYSKEALKEARQNDCSKYILDHSETEVRGGINKLHASGDELQQFGFKNSDHIAIIIANFGNESDLLDPVTQNSRWSKLKYFYTADINKAYEWLNN